MFYVSGQGKVGGFTHMVNAALPHLGFVVKNHWLKLGLKD